VWLDTEQMTLTFEPFGLEHVDAVLEWDQTNHHPLQVCLIGTSANEIKERYRQSASVGGEAGSSSGPKDGVLAGT
jgi:hypothetical protein